MDGRAEHQEDHGITISREVGKERSHLRKEPSAEVTGEAPHDQGRAESAFGDRGKEMIMESQMSNGLLEQILSRENMFAALRRVRANRGSCGVDGMTTDELPTYLKIAWPFIRQELLAGEYEPKPVRRVEIPKPDGGKRMLGIPTVLDRLIQQAIAQILSPIFEEGFSDHSYGFRPKRSAHDAVDAAQAYMQAGDTWVVDMDLEKFFDRVNHDILMSRVARKVGDKTVLALIRKYLASGVMLNGVKVSTEEGTPQGGPLSPLLANIILDDLDKELERRGHKFCRYADDCNIYVRSRRAGIRVMEKISRYITTQLKLKVNQAKSAVDRPWKRKFLGFSVYWRKEEIRPCIHPRSIQRFKEKVREITNRNRSMSLEGRLERLGQITDGWINYYGYADAKRIVSNLDEWIRHRLRAIIWKQWKRIKTKHDNLAKLGIDDPQAWEWANTRKQYWRVARSPILHTALTNEYLESIGYKSMFKRYLAVHMT